MGKVDWQKCAAVIFCVMAAVAGGWLAAKYLLGVLLPFIIAWAVAMVVSPVAGWISEKSKISRKFCSAVLLVLFLGILITVTSLAVDRLIFELGRLLEWLGQGGGGVIREGLSDAARFIGSIGERLSIFGADGGDGGEFDAFISSVNDMALKFMTDMSGRFSSWLSAAALGFVKGLPSVLLMLTVTVIACFYFCLDFKSLGAALLSLLPPRLAERLPSFRARLYNAVGRWLRAYFILFGITAFELLLGFLVLGVEYPLLLAIIGALVDILPVFGTGTILIPWGIFALLGRDFKTGFGLLILYALSVVVRQIAEPKVIGGSLGIHPLLTLMSLYAGFNLFGVAGMIFAPAFLTVLGGAFGLRGRSEAGKQDKN